MVKQARAELTRQQIVSGAAAQFEKTGYGSTSMSDIVEGAGTTKGALYFHFASKDELAQFVIAEQHRMSIESVQSISATSASPLEKTIMLTHEMARQIVEEPIVRAGIRLTLELSTFEGPVEPYADWINACTELMQQAKDSGQIKPSVDVAALGRFIPSAFTGVQLVSNVITRRSDLTERVDEMWQLLLPGIVSGPVAGDVDRLVKARWEPAAA
ncbi:TetR family transcriptional regulator [Rhodococcus sp. KBS0724]|uniref:ScbR family autoregulator-binding transcription factor n=1 Tax=Rhodococcus sp. KBS0724 TaxID=1179674 RepID=UPI00110D5A75|nr:ScbR family autoregulator-binding transcription factor [Rhodococcus sp. KBS0724]TSD47432.1 TetR family transcriptional regulator [Rhodococcus sp. KBS0724]